MAFKVWSRNSLRMIYDRQVLTLRHWMLSNCYHAPSQVYVSSIGLSGPWDFVIKPFLPLELYSWQVDFDGLCSFLLLPMLMLEWWCLPWSWNTLSRSKTCHLFWMYYVYSNLLLRPGSHSAWGFQGVLLRFCLASTRQQKFLALKAETFIILFVFLKLSPCLVDWWKRNFFKTKRHADVKPLYSGSRFFLFSCIF